MEAADCIKDSQAQVELRRWEEAKAKAVKEERFEDAIQCRNKIRTAQTDCASDAVRKQWSAAGHGVTADVMRRRISTLAGAGATALFDNALKAHCAALHVDFTPEHPSQSLCDIALLDLSRATLCQGELAHTAALVELVYGAPGGVDASTCVSNWVKQLSKAEAVLQKSLRTLDQQAAAWDAGVANLAKTGDNSLQQVSLIHALSSSDKFKGFMEGA